MKYGFRSGLEEAIAADLTEREAVYWFESHKVPYEAPATEHTYTPDFILPNGIVVETKGRFLTADRKKHQLIKAQCPSLDLRFVFSNPNARISKTSRTTYAKWCEQHGFQYAAKRIPDSWLQEPVNPRSLLFIQSCPQTKQKDRSTPSARKRRNTS